MSVGSERSFVVDAEEIAEEIKKVASESISEEDLRQGVEYILKSRVLEKLQIPWGSWRPLKARYEVTLVSGARLDALYGHVIIEYERPKAFETTSGFEKAVEQVKRYIRDHAQIEARFPRYFGVVLDGHKIGFVRYREVLKGFESKGPFDVNKSTLARFIEAIIGLRRKALSADELLKDFGPGSPVAREAIKAFYSKLQGTTSRTNVLFNDWKRVFSQVCAYSPDKLKGLEERYGFVGRDVDVEKLLFSLHTYFALMMKLLAAEVAALYVAPRLWSYLKALEDAYYRSHERLRDELKELEEGGIFARLGITNFLEADYFAWYLDEWDEQLAKHITSIIKKLSDYDPSAAELEPERVKDLFKRVYQNLAPKKIRHDLGEYYTPDWLAEFVLNEVGWTLETFERKAEETGSSLAPLELRLLDPACGSGTFLVLAISRLRSYVEEHWVDKGVALRRITKNIVGFDLNPLAVIASRTNYLIALGDMLREKGAEPVEIPIYLADSIMVEQRPTVFGASAYILKTVAGEFTVPTSIIERGLLTKVLLTLEECVAGKYAPNEFKARLLKEISIEKTEVSFLIDLFKTLAKLESEGKNKIWLRVLKNSFAPLFVGKFDYVVGNPPWVLWDNLPDDYRRALESLLRYYGLWKPGERWGGSKIDISTLFTYVCNDKYLHDQGSFAFLITQSLLKSKGAGEKFRRFRIRQTPLNPLLVHDLVEIKPFEGANNRTASIFLKKGERIEYPVNYILWRTKAVVDQTDSLNEALRKTERIKMLARPSDERNPLSPWLTLPEKALNAVEKARGKSRYKCYAGIYSGGTNAVYWFKIIDVQGEKETDIDVPPHVRKFFGEKVKKLKFLFVENITKGMKKKIKKVRTVVEDFFVYPMIKSKHVEKWKINGYIYTLQMHDPVKRIGYDERWVKINFPETYSHLKGFEDVLRERAAFKKYMKPRRAPFYSMYDVGEYTYAPYKVVWNQMGSKLSACVVGKVNDRFLGDKLVLPEHVLGFVSTANEDEAHYICAILNSSIVDLILRSIAGGTKSFGTPKIIEDSIKIPEYDVNNEVHVQLATLSKKAHQLASESNTYELSKVEEEIDRTVSELYGITDEELMDIKNALKILEGEEIEEGEIEELPALEPDITLANPVVEENKPFNLGIIIRNPLEETMRNIKLKVELPTKTVERLFDNVEKEQKLEAELGALMKGKYKVKLTMDYALKGATKRLEKELILFVKGKEERKPLERIDIDELFGD